MNPIDSASHFMILHSILRSNLFSLPFHDFAYHFLIKLFHFMNLCSIFHLNQISLPFYGSISIFQFNWFSILFNDFAFHFSAHSRQAFILYFCLPFFHWIDSAFNFLVFHSSFFPRRYLQFQDIAHHSFTYLILLFKARTL